MATGRDNDVLPLRSRTKMRLARAKGTLTYDELLRSLLDLAPAEAARARAEQGRLVAAARAEAMRRGRTLTSTPSRDAEVGAGPRLRRSPEKQLLVAHLAEARWRRWQAEGRVTRIGARRYAFRTGVAVGAVGSGGETVVERRPGRGLPR